MNKEFIPYEQALELKELGFDEPCFGWFRTTLMPSNFTEYFLETELDLNQEFTDLINNNFTGGACSAPLYQQAFRWFREKHGLFSVIDVDQTMEPLFCYSLSKYKGDFQWNNILPTYSELYYTYEEAELACLKKLIEIAKQK